MATILVRLMCFGFTLLLVVEGTAVCGRITMVPRQILARKLPHHALDLAAGNTAIQNHSIPVLFVHVVARSDENFTALLPIG